MSIRLVPTILRFNRMLRRPISWKPSITAFSVWMLVFILVSGIVFWVFHGRQPESDLPPGSLPLVEIQKIHGAQILSRTDDAITFRLAFRKNPHVTIAFRHQLANTKIRLSFDRLEGVKQLRIYPIFSENPSLKKGYIALPVGKAGGIRHEYNARLPDGSYQALRIAFKSGEHFGKAVLKNVSISRSGLTDNPVWVYGIAWMLASFLLIPGILLRCLLHCRADDQHLDSVFMLYSVGYYLAAYLIWLGWGKIGLPGANAAVGTGVFLGLPALFWINRLRGGLERLRILFRRMHQKIVIFLLAVLGSSFLICHNVNLPLENTWYSEIAGKHTYRAFHAHDAVFQYVNGVAISNDEPFEKYYGGGKLIYGIEDRGILPGIIYAVFRILLLNFSTFLADSYLVYTLIGIGLNALILFPAADFAARYTRTHSTYLFFLAFSLNAFILVNYYLTWYKMAGAAFFLTGLYLLFQTRGILTTWGGAGAAMGVGANLHAGSALGIPLYFLWAVLRNFKGHSSNGLKALAGPCLLVAVFGALNLPWALVKGRYFNDQHRLIKEHFFSGYSPRAGLSESLAIFFKKVPWSEQLPRRLQRAWNSLRFSNIFELANTLQKRGIAGFCRKWSANEFTFTAFVLYPVLVLFLMAKLFGLRKRSACPDMAQNSTGLVPSMPTLTMLSVATLMAVIFLSYGRHAPDITYHQPMGVLVLLYVLLLGKVMAGPIAVRFAAGAYFTFAAWRLFAFGGL